MAGALTAAQIVALALQISKTGSVTNGIPYGFTAQAGVLLNAILSGLCQDYDFDLAKKTLNFVFTPARAQIGNLNASLASGPFYLPPDYLRAKKGDVMWFNSNFPYKLVPVDLEEFDQFVQQAGIMSYPTCWATDMSQPQILTTTATLTPGSATLTNVASTTGLVIGLVAQGPNIPVNTTVIAISPDVVLSAPVGGTGVAVDSLTVVFQQPPLAYVWPPASGAYPCMVRYYSQMAPIDTPHTSPVVPWFPNSDYLKTELAGQLMQLSGDDRWEGMLSDNSTLHPGGSRVILRRYLNLKDDTSNRSKRVTLDRRRFGAGRSSLPPSKTLGW